jgi:hypothetical protein
MAVGRPFAQQRHRQYQHRCRQHQRGLLRWRYARPPTGERDPIAFVLQDLGEQLADADFIVDDQNFLGIAIVFLVLLCSCCGEPAARGVEREYECHACAARCLTRPPAHRDVFFTMDPRPVPFALVVT